MFVPGRRRLSPQRGAIGLSVALVLMSAVLFVTLAVDTGRLALEKRRLQQVADLSAIHAASVASCGGAESPDAAAVAAAAQAVAAQNGYSGDLAAESGAVTLGKTQTVSGVRQFDPTASAGDADAVRVIAASDFPTSLVARGLFPGNTRLQAVAVANKELLAGFRLGSFLARLSTGNSVLNPLFGGLLGSSFNLDLVSYQGIAAAEVSLRDLIDASAGIGTVNELLTTSFSVGDFLDLLIDAAGPGSTAGVALNQMRMAGVGALPPITLGDILAVTGANPESALDAEVNVFDLLSAGLQLANKQNAVSIPAFNLNIAPLAALGLSLYVVEPPKIAIGPPGKNSAGEWRTETRTAQLRLQLDLSALDLTLGGLITTEVDLSLYLDAAAADAHLRSVRCPTVDDPVYHVAIGVQPGLASLGVGQFADLAGGTTQASPTLDVVALGLTVANVSLSATASVQNPAAGDVTFDVSQTPIPSPPPPEMTRTVGTEPATGIANAVATLSDSLQIQVNVLPALDSPVLVLVKATIQTLLASLPGVLLPILQQVLSVAATSVLDPLLAALGLQLGGADVTLILLLAKPSLLVM